MEKTKIKIKSSELRKKSREELLKLKKQLEIHLLKAQAPKYREKGEKGFNIKEEKKNIARINTILNEKRKEESS